MAAARNTTLVILPGWGGSTETWASFASMMTSEVKNVQIIELPCFGSEPCPPAVWGVEEYASFVKKKMNDIPGEKVLLGHSFGGQVATYLIATEPTLCDTLILSGAAIIRPKRRVKRAVFGVIASIGKLVLRIPGMRQLEKPLKHLLHRVADSPDYGKTTAVQREIFQKVIRQDMRHLLSNIRCRTLVISGTHDRYVPLRHSKQVAQLLPNGILSIVPGGTHGLHIKKQEEFKRAILTFLAD